MLKIKTGPATEPISLAEAKLFLRIDDSSEDALIETLISAAREMAENFTLRAFITQTWTMNLDEIPSGMSPDFWEGTITGHAGTAIRGGERAIVIPRPPLIGINSLKTYDDSNTPTVFPAAGYDVDINSAPGRMILRSGSTWPTDLRPGNGVEIEFEAGYGDATKVPKPIKMAIYMILAKIYECRGSGADMPELAKKLLQPYRVYYASTVNPRGC